MATSSTYCTHRVLEDVFPNVNDYDSKEPIYGWTSGITDYEGSSIDIFYAANTGLVTQLFVDGNKLTSKAFNTTANTTIATTALTHTATSVTVADEAGFSADDIIKGMSEEWFNLIIEE